MSASQIFASYLRNDFIQAKDPILKRLFNINEMIALYETGKNLLVKFNTPYALAHFNSALKLANTLIYESDLKDSS